MGKKFDESKGKENKPEKQPPNVVPPAKNGESKPAGEGGKKKKNKAVKEETPEGRLAKLRPKRRLIFVIAFVGFAVWVLAMHNPCGSKVVQKKEDCGWSGISAFQCQTGGCFLAGGGERVTHKVAVTRDEGTLFGMTLATDDIKTKKTMSVISIESGGAVASHNARLPQDSEDRIRVGDEISKFDGETGSAMLGALKNTAAKDYKIIVKRSKLPSFLQFLAPTIAKYPKLLGPVEKVLTSSGSGQWARWTSRLGGLGFTCWFFSGYPVASLPLYLTVSGAVAWGVTRCCHDEKVTSGPHCYKSAPAELETLVPTLWQNTVDFAQKVSADPKKQFAFMTSWQKDFRWVYDWLVVGKS